MDSFLLAAITLGVAVGYFLLVHRLNRRRTPASAFFWAVALGTGALSILPGLALYSLAAGLGFHPSPSRWSQVLFIWTINAPLEELTKYLCFALMVGALKSLREPQDGAWQGSVVGLGFGLVENLMYGLSDGLALFLLRTVVSLPGHAIYGAVWGGYHGFEVYQSRGTLRRPWVPLLALVPAIFAHALFNTLVLFDAPLVQTVLGDLLTLGFGLFLYRRLLEESPVRRPRPLREWRQAIPELEHALVLDPKSVDLRRRLSAYLLVADQPGRALQVLDELPSPGDPWVEFYREAASRRLSPPPLTSPIPEISRLDPKLFRRLSGG